jgi:glycosyltransferase involved in cell wall biosynthesis
MTQKTSLGIVVPCFNEEHNVANFEAEMSQFMALATDLYPQLEINFYVVENNSTDGTAGKLSQMAGRHNKVQVVSCKTQGYGAALKHGFVMAKNHQYISFLDFDNTYPMTDILKMLTELQEKGLDLIYGARLHDDSKIDLVRKAGNRLYVILLKALLRSHLSDVCSGMRVFRSELAGSIVKLDKDDLSFSIQFTSQALLSKWKVGEMPINYRKRVGSSKLSVVKDGVIFLLVAVKAGLLKKI